MSLGEADAAIVYRTDAATANQTVEMIAIPSELNAVAEYLDLLARAGAVSFRR